MKKSRYEEIMGDLSMAFEANSKAIMAVVKFVNDIRADMERQEADIAKLLEAYEREHGSAEA